MILGFLVGCGLASGAGAQPPPDDALNQRAREILAVHCAPCREVGALTSPSARAADDRPLDLAAIARDPNLVRPGNPDGSPAYTAMMRRLALAGTQPATSPNPGIEALATLRAWIESLPISAETCTNATELTRRHIEPLLTRHAVVQSKPVAALRVLTLAHLDAGCVTAAQLAGWRDALGLFLAALAGSPKPVPLLPLDDAGHHLAIDIRALGWDNDHWRVLTGAAMRASRSNEPLIVRADWLIVHVLRGDFGARFVKPSEPPLAKPRSFHDPEFSAEDRAIVQEMLSVASPPETLALATANILQLARAHLAPAGLVRVAAELGIERAVLERAVTTSAGGVKSLLLRLAYGTIPREEIEDGWLLIGRIGGATPPVRTTLPVQFDAVRPSITPQTPVDLILYADRARYAAGDEAQFTVRSNVNCHLTVISIDTKGHGTVIFPNDFASRNAISAHLNLVVPAPGAGYRFRLKEKGRERIVAMCTRGAGIVEGIEHDFERQRFQELGPYAAHLGSALKSAMKRRSAGEDRAASETPKPSPDDAPAVSSEAHHVPLTQIWRTGIVLEID